MLEFARVVGASRSCRSRRYTLVPLLWVAPLSSPGPRVQHPTPHRGVRLVCLCINGILLDGTHPLRRGGPPCPPAVTHFKHLSMDAMSIRSRGGCLTLVPKSPVYTFKAPVGGSTFVSRPSRSTSHPASRCYVCLSLHKWNSVGWNTSSALGRTAASASGDAFQTSVDGCYFNALAFIIPPRIALVGWFYGFDVSDDDEFCVGVDRRVRPRLQNS
jgi:hypothetical protein